jgi:hypothetical protein
MHGISNTKNACKVCERDEEKEERMKDKNTKEIISGLI